MVAAVFPLSQLSSEIVPCALGCHFLSDSYLLICLESGHPCYSTPGTLLLHVRFPSCVTSHIVLGNHCFSPTVSSAPLLRGLGAFPLVHPFSSLGGSHPLAGPLNFAVPQRAALVTSPESSNTSHCGSPHWPACFLVSSFPVRHSVTTEHSFSSV